MVPRSRCPSSAWTRQERSTASWTRETATGTRYIAPWIAKENDALSRGTGAPSAPATGGLPEFRDWRPRGAGEPELLRGPRYLSLRAIVRDAGSQGSAPRLHRVNSPQEIQQFLRQRPRERHDHFSTGMMQLHCRCVQKVSRQRNRGLVLAAHLARRPVQRIAHHGMS